MGDEQNTAFEKIKAVVISAPVLITFPYSDQKIFVTTDTSDIGYGAVSEVDCDDGIHPVSYFFKH